MCIVGGPYPGGIEGYGGGNCGGIGYDGNDGGGVGLMNSCFFFFLGLLFSICRGVDIVNSVSDFELLKRIERLTREGLLLLIFIFIRQYCKFGICVI